MCVPVFAFAVPAGCSILSCINVIGEAVCIAEAIEDEDWKNIFGCAKKKEVCTLLPTLLPVRGRFLSTLWSRVGFKWTALMMMMRADLRLCWLLQCLGRVPGEVWPLLNGPGTDAEAGEGSCRGEAGGVVNAVVFEEFFCSKVQVFVSAEDRLLIATRLNRSIFMLFITIVARRSCSRVGEVILTM